MEERTRDLKGLQVRTLNSIALAICNGTGPFARPTGRGRVEVIDEGGRRREGDLRGALRNPNERDPKDGSGADAKEPGEAPDGEAQDYQLTRALDLLRGLALFDNKATN